MDDFAHIVGEDVHFRGRSPSGERGLKLEGRRLHRQHGESLPIRGAWIEMELNNRIYRFPQVAPHPGSVD